MWHLTSCKISVNPSVLNSIKNKMICYRVSELMLATFIKVTKVVTLSVKCRKTYQVYASPRITWTAACDFKHVRLAKTYSRLGIHAVWSDSSMFPGRNRGSLTIQRARIGILIRLNECSLLRFKTKKHYQHQEINLICQQPWKKRNKSMKDRTTSKWRRSRLIV